MKNVVLIVLVLFFPNYFFAQTLASFGTHSISRDEFLTAFRKNNLRVKPTDAAYREYLNLYIRYRLKVQAALDLQLDTLAAQRTELQGFRNQIIDQYTNDEASLNEMAKEAFQRSQQDIRVSYIFVAAPKNAPPADTLKAWQKIQEAAKGLQQNRTFGETALQFSEDPFVKVNQGDIGYVTVFDLPYSMETIAYQSAVGKNSPVFRADGGYIILRKTAERPARGRIRIAQILLSFPFQATEADKITTHQRADSIYNLLRSGGDFAGLAKKFSGDNLSYQMGGVLPEFGIGKYEAGFELAAFNLKKDGDISEPYPSSFGYHIIKRISRKPVPVVADRKTLDEFRDKIKNDPRVMISRKQMLQTILKETRFKEVVVPGDALWSYTDSIMQNKQPVGKMNSQTVLFQFPGKAYTVGDWLQYRRSLKGTPSLTNGKTNTDLFNAFRQSMAFEYYKNNLEKYNKEFAAQTSEFRDGNLLFEIMQRQVWMKASADSAALRKYFDSHQTDYRWKPGADAIIFNLPASADAKKIQARLGDNISDWKKIVEEAGGQIQADSGRFDRAQIPGKSPFLPGHFTAGTTNEDRSVQFAYIVRTFADSSPRTYEEARGLAINDYQNEVENRWIDFLMKEYPVKINDTVLKSLPK